MSDSIGRLTLVGTPIGNLSDFSPRAIEALENCDFIAAEDTRVTLKLLNHFGITKPLVSYHEHNKRESGERLCARLSAGENGVLVSDAGMPAISDPGEDLVNLCHQKGIPVGVVPGPTAVTTALALAGLPTGRFAFEGFLSVNKRSRRTHLESLKNEMRTMVFYEAPHKLKYTLIDLLGALGDRPIALVREITKIHEEVVRTTLCAAVEKYESEEPRGEFVLIVGGATPEEATPATPEEAAELARAYLAEGMSPSEAAKAAAADTRLKKGEIYRLLIAKED
ncbi:MAG: 16S rRNA (cytidine(1402)-2'-O)-methyltransferase [Clostridia bacterium]|nr:16S rRNA (cytidine(1402)-2'-O)-methyltransferase [Clostridia bacterium]